MKRLLTLVLAALCFVACTQNEVEELTANREALPETLTVGFEGGDTRVELNEALKTVWSKGDEVSVFYLSDANQKWQYQGETGERLGTLKCVDRGVAEEKMQRVVVAYPHNDQYVVNTDSHNLYASLPAVQSYKEGSYGSEGNIMVAQSEFTQFSLKSVCGWLRVELTGEGQKVDNITLRGNAGEQVAGLIYVDTATAKATLASEMGEASDEEEVGGVGGGLEFDDTVFTEVTLDCGDGVELSSEATAFYIALLPQTFEHGMTLKVNYANGKSQALICENSITISRNHISPIESEANVEVEVPTNQLWYTATALVEPYDTSAFNVAIVSNEWNEATGEGIITFDGELTTIGDVAFYECSSLKSVTIGNSVTTIGDYAFTVCDSLTSVTIGDGVTTIGEGAFCCCHSLAEFNGKFATDGGRCLIIDGVLNAFAFGCGVTEYTIPNSVTTIGDEAFYGCSSLTSVTIPDSVTTIGEQAFYVCGSLTSVTIGDSVTTIRGYAFAFCDSLTNVTIGDSVTTIGEAAFTDCSSLTSVTIGDSVTTIGKGAFFWCDSLTSVTIPDSVTTIGEDAFGGCSSLAEFKGKFAADGGCCLIKDNTIIAYAEASGTTYTIPDSVTTIGDYAFYYCTSLTSVTIPDSVTTIGDSAFNSCDSLTSVTIGDSVTTIEEWAFGWCSSLTSVIIPDSVTTIGDRAFYDCDSLTSVYCEATTPPTLGDSYVFDDNASGRKIYVPAESVEEYKAADGWSEYAADIVGYNFETGEEVAISNKLFYTSTALVEPYFTSAFNVFIVSNEWDEATGEGIITFDGELTTIGDDAFSYCHNLTSVTIGDSVTTIGDSAFYYCYSLTSVTIPDSVTTIGDSAFIGCRSLTSVTIPDSVTTIGDQAFYGCSSLTSVTIPDSVMTIGDGVFAVCSNLAEFKGKFAADGGRCLIKDNTLIAYAKASGATYTIPDGVTTIGEGAFRSCYDLTSITIPDSVTTIGNWAFDSCSSLTSVTIPDSVTTIGEGAFWDCSSLTSVTIPDSVTTIGEGAFWDCSSLTSVTIPDSVTTIEDHAFYWCESLTSVYCEATTPPTLDGSYVFDSNKSGRKIYVPAESVEAYKAASYWSEYAADIVGYDFETGVVVE